MTRVNRLLIVDHDAAVCELFMATARRDGFEVKAVSRAADVLLSLRTFVPTAIILDLQMPDADGIELLKLLADERCSARVLVVSGGDKRVLKAAMRFGTARGLRMAGALQKRIAALSTRLSPPLTTSTLALQRSSDNSFKSSIPSASGISRSRMIAVGANARRDTSTSAARLTAFTSKPSRLAVAMNSSQTAASWSTMRRRFTRVMQLASRTRNIRQPPSGAQERILACPRNAKSDNCHKFGKFSHERLGTGSGKSSWPTRPGQLLQKWKI